MHKVMIVDNATIARKHIAQVLAKSEFEVSGEAGGRSQALFVARRADAELVLLDLDMPDGEGWHILENFSQNFQTMEVIGMTDSLSREQVKKAGQWGVKHILSKPLETTKLLEALHAGLRDREAALLKKDIPVEDASVAPRPTAPSIPSASSIPPVSSTEPTVVQSGLHEMHPVAPVAAPVPLPPVHNALQTPLIEPNGPTPGVALPQGAPPFFQVTERAGVRTILFRPGFSSRYIRALQKVVSGPMAVQETVIDFGEVVLLPDEVLGGINMVVKLIGMAGGRVVLKASSPVLVSRIHTLGLKDLKGVAASGNP